MAITFVGVGAPSASASGDKTVALPAATQTDDILLIICGSYGSSALSCSGYTKKAEYIESNAHVTVFWKRHDGSESSALVTGAADSIVCLMVAFRGVDTGADPWDAYDAGEANGTGLVVSTPALTTSTNGAMAIGAGSSSDNHIYDPASTTYGNTSAPQGSGYANTILGSDCAVFWLYGVQSVAGDVGTLTATQSNRAAAQWVSTIGALKPAEAAVTFDLTIACSVADEGAAAWTQPDITGYSSTGSDVGDTVTISGTGFGTDGIVRFGTTAANVTSWADTLIRVVIPDVADASYTVTVAPSGEY